MKKHVYFVQTAIVITAVIFSISLANVYSKTMFYIFYNLIYGLLLSTALPLYLVHKNGESIRDMGVKKIGARQMIVLLVFDVFSIGGQSIPLIINSTAVHFENLSKCILPLVMSTLFEEFLFRGYFQVRIENRYGWFPAIIISGLLFSVYHLGYPGFRDLGDLFTLFLVGIGFSAAFKLSGSNVIVSYFVNLPNAILTYLLKEKQFPPFDRFTSVIAGITILLFFGLILFCEKNKIRFCKN